MSGTWAITVQQVSKSAADWAYIDAKGKPGVIIFTDSQAVRDPTS